MSGADSPTEEQTLERVFGRGNLDTSCDNDTAQLRGGCDAVQHFIAQELKYVHAFGSRLCRRSTGRTVSLWLVCEFLAHQIATKVLYLVQHTHTWPLLFRRREISFLFHCGSWLTIPVSRRGLELVSGRLCRETLGIHDGRWCHAVRVALGDCMTDTQYRSWHADVPTPSLEKCWPIGPTRHTCQGGYTAALRAIIRGSQLEAMCVLCSPRELLVVSPHLHFQEPLLVNNLDSFSGSACAPDVGSLEVFKLQPLQT